MTNPAEVIMGALRVIDAMDPRHRKGLLDAVHHEVQVRRGPLMQPLAVLTENIHFLLANIPRAAEATDQERNDALRDVLAEAKKMIAELDFHEPGGRVVEY